MDPADSLRSMSISGSKDGLRLDGLPSEIQDLIFHFVVLDSDRDELKCFRQSSRYFRDRADVYIFRTLHISASSLSLERVRCVSQNDRLRAHVRELIFHRGTFFGHHMAKFAAGSQIQPRDYDRFETYMVRTRPCGQLGDLMRISKCYDAFTEELQAESLFNRDMSWRSTMRKYCAQFPRLDKLTTWSNDWDVNSIYLQRRCGLTYQTTTPNYFAPYEIFETCGPEFKPKALSLYSVNGEDFASIITNIRGGAQAVKERFSELKRLRLSFSETVGTLELDRTYEFFIPACMSLQLLSLDFTSFYSPKMLKDSESFPQKLIQLVLQQRFSNLEHLSLTYPFMTENDFLTFLKGHRSTLKTLELNRWPMPTTTSGESAGSIIRAFWKMGQLRLPQLESIKLSGEFSNRADGEGWTADPSGRVENPSPTLSRLLRYLEDSGSNDCEFPFPISAETMDNAKTGQQLAGLDETPRASGCSDATFEWWESS